MTARCSSRPRTRSAPGLDRSREWWARNRETYIATRAVLVADHPFLFRPDRPAVLCDGITDLLVRRYRGRFGRHDIETFLTFWIRRREYIEAAARARWRWGPFPSLPRRNPAWYRK